MLTPLRRLLSLLDKATLALIGWRMRVAVRIGREKQRRGLPVHQPQQWEAVRLRLDKQGHAAGLSTRFIESYGQAVHLESLLKQHKAQGHPTDEV